jgi:hypothetical protein
MLFRLFLARNIFHIAMLMKRVDYAGRKIKIVEADLNKA